MFRWVHVSVWCFLMAATPASLFAQVNPYTNRFNPYAPAAESGPDPRLRRAYRERAVAAIGPHVRDFVETHGDEAVAAIFACSKAVAVKLAEFHTSGEMAKLSRPRDLLRVIAQPGHGDDVALWAVRHARELIDADSFEAYLISPLDYALGLKSLAAGAAEARANRLNQAALATAPPACAALPAWVNEKLLLGAGFLVIVALLLWKRKQSSVG